MIEQSNQILITGGAGFIGTHLTKKLIQSGFSVKILDNLSEQVHGKSPDLSDPIYQSEKLTFIRGDVLDQQLLKKCLVNVDAIVHLAAETGTAQSMYEIAHYNNVNSQGTALLLDTLANTQHKVKKFILASSRSIYGEGAYDCTQCGNVYPESRPLSQLKSNNWELTCPSCSQKNIKPIPTPETARVNPASIYAATKYAQEDLARIACDSFGVNAVVLRFQNVYGVGQSLNNPYTGILSIFSTRIRRNLSLPIFEDGLESRDFIYVDDVVNAIELSLKTKLVKSTIYNVGSGQPTSVFNIATKLVECFEGQIQPHITGQFRLGDIRHCYADLNKIKSELGFNPKISINEGLNKFVAWVKTQPLPEDKLDKANSELQSRGMMS